MTGGAEFNRDTSYIEDRITHDGRPGVNGEPGWRVKAGRYRLIAARACQCANRTVIVRRLLGLEHAISLGQPGPTHDARSGTFDLDPGGVDPVLGIERIQSAYSRRFPDYPRGITVPAIVDVAGGTVVTNNFPQITLDFVPRGRHHHGGRRPTVHHLGQVRCSLPRAFQVQPAEADRTAGSVGATRRTFSRLPVSNDTIDFVQIKQHYYIVHEDINPTGIAPQGPDLAGWLEPHGRELLGGRPFGDGTPPGPVRPGEEVAPGHGAAAHQESAF